MQHWCNAWTERRLESKYATVLEAIDTMSMNIDERLRDMNAVYRGLETNITGWVRGTRTIFVE